MRTRWFGAAVFVIALVPGAAGLARADIIISNLPGNDGNRTFLNAPPGGASGGAAYDSKAAGFILPAGGSFTLSSAQLRLSFFDTASVPVISLYGSDVAGNPGPLLFTFNNPPFKVGTDTFTFTPPGPFHLLPGSTYWVVASNAATVPDSFLWMENDPPITPTGIATSAGFRFDFTGPAPLAGGDTFFSSFQVNGSLDAVPEPSTLTLLALGGAALAGWRRWKGRYTRATAWGSS
jgi:hypothetical protein